MAPIKYSSYAVVVDIKWNQTLKNLASVDSTGTFIASTADGRAVGSLGDYIAVFLNVSSPATGYRPPAIRVGTEVTVKKVVATSVAQVTAI